MSDNEKTEQEIKEEKDKLNSKVDEAGDKAKKDAEAKGATPEEVQAQVEKARKEEKDKLYPQIESLKSELKGIQDLLKEERDEKERVKKEQDKETEKERQSKLSDQERVQEALNRLEEQLKNEQTDRKKLEKQLEKKAQEDALRQYRDKLILDNADEIIPELVVGSTKEELDKALDIAKARFKEFAERFKQRQSETTRRNMPRSTNPDLEALEEQELAQDLAALDQDKYMTDPEYRKQIQQKLELEYERAAGRR